ncbi:MAG: GNAT family N-acetyltransferase [Erysipelotrichaceae bacterium]|nr:GNAT family N-acetyltransferase [Erysipelotrichaceae bacterium]
MKAIRTILACLRKADQSYNLIQDGDRIAIGISGGKDSLTLLYSLFLYTKFSHKNFVIKPVILDLGFPNFNPVKIQEYCRSLGMELIVNDSKDVYKILTIQQQKMNLNHLPCSICSRMKKAAINKVAKELGCNKVAFAHHADDAIETLFMNEIYGARIATFTPKMTLENAGIVFIRPLILCREKEIEKLVKEENIPVVQSTCPADKHTSRQDIKLALKGLYKNIECSEENFLTMLSNYERVGLWGDELSYQVDQKGLYLKPVVTPKDEAICLDIRYQVFEKEMKVSHKKEYEFPDEFIAKQFLIYKKLIPIGTIRYIEEENKIHIQRFAILKKYRGKGIGRKVFEYFNKMLESRYNPTTLYLHSMWKRKDFYKSFGYIENGKPFIEAGIKHVEMIKKV